MKIVYPALFTPLEKGTGYCVAFPDLPGCVTEGDSWVLDELEDGNPVPEASRREDIPITEPQSFVNLVVLDMDSYAEKYGQKAVRKNCTIPAWLNTLAEKKGISFSEALQEGLAQKLNLKITA